jgi:1-phosphofructokinase
MEDLAPAIITITLNPAIDRTIRIEQFAPGEHLPGQTLGRVAGGKGINVSRVLAALGAESTAMGVIGQDNAHPFNELFADGLIRDGLLRVAGHTRENVTLLDDATGLDTHIRDAGLSLSPAALRELGEQLGATIENGDLVIFAGSLPPDMDAAGFADLLKLAVDAGGHVAVDTSGPGLDALPKAKLWLIKPNLAELEQLVGRRLPDLPEQLKAARGLAQKYEYILLSRGADGAVLVTRDGALAGRCDIAEAVNTVGCGDALLAGFVAQALAGGLPADNLAAGLAVAAAAAATPTPATFDPETLEKHLTAVNIETL